MGLAKPQSAVFSALIFNALIIPMLDPACLARRPFPPTRCRSYLLSEFLIYGVWGGLDRSLSSASSPSTCLISRSLCIGQRDMLNIMTSCSAHFPGDARLSVRPHLSPGGDRLGQWLMPYQANGSLETERGRNHLGSAADRADWDGPVVSRPPSATTGTDPNDPQRQCRPPTTPQLRQARTWADLADLTERLAADSKALEQAQPELHEPSASGGHADELGLGSRSGYQPSQCRSPGQPRGRARGVPVAQFRRCWSNTYRGRGLGIFGEPRVNVFLLNWTLQRTYPKRSDRSPRS